MFWPRLHFIWWSLKGKSYVFLWFYRYFWCISIFRNRDGITKVNCLPYDFSKMGFNSHYILPLNHLWKDKEIQRGMSPWWRHQMKTFTRYWPFVWGIHRSPVISPHKGKWRGFDIFFDLRLNRRLSKQSWGRWCDTPLRSLWRHCKGTSAS